MSPDIDVTTETTEIDVTTETTESEPVVDTTAPSSYPRTRKGFLELQLKNLLMEEMAMRQQIKDSKTNAKKNHFKKKLRKIDLEAKKYIAALRRMEDPNA